ncbi:unnamed protein product [Ilex paraguariensis]|uniref:Uncharacterized protein n=1 Tax=Ilex paraguariensis TaxID=185542 RepID=A0ABC8U5X8_9AQUA
MMQRISRARRRRRQIYPRADTNKMRKESPMQWAGEDWGSPATQTLFSDDTSDLDLDNGKRMKLEEERLLENKKEGFSSSSTTAATEVKIKISKKQLDKLLGSSDVRRLSGEQLIAQLMSMNVSHGHGLDLDFDFDVSTTLREDFRPQQARQSSTATALPTIEEDDNDFQSPMVGSDPQVSDPPRSYKRLRRGSTSQPTPNVRKRESVDSCKVDDDIEEFSSQEDRHRGKIRELYSVWFV